VRSQKTLQEHNPRKIYEENQHKESEINIENKYNENRPEKKLASILK